MHHRKVFYWAITVSLGGFLFGLDTAGISGCEKNKMTAIKNAFALDLLVVTRGEKSAVSLGVTGFYQHDGVKVEVVDTIGSGDAFLAGYHLSKFLQKKSPAECLDFGCRMGAFVAAQRGGTPVFSFLKI